MSQDIETATFKRRGETAYDRYQRDIRYRRTLQAIVSHVMREHGPVDPERADRDAHDIALKVGATLLETLYEEDGEVAMLRMEADTYRKLAEKSLTFSSFPPLIVKDTALTSTTPNAT